MDFKHMPDVSQVQGGPGDFTPIPAGVYMGQIVSAEEKANNDGSGWHLSLQFSIVGEKYAGRRVWGNITTDSSDPQKIATGHRHLANLFDALGTGRHVTSSEQIVNKVCPIKVIIQKPTEQYPKEGNFVSEYGLGADKDYRPSAAPQSPVDYGINGPASSPAQGLKKPPIGF